MIISPKDTIKLFGISIMAMCAVFVCTLFLNFNIDVQLIEGLITTPQMMGFYEAQTIMAKVVSAISGGCLALTSVVMLFFYIKQYIDTHHKELGILKAMGYSRWSIAKSFSMFGLCILVGAAIGYLSSHLMMPVFYRAMNADHILPDVAQHFNPILMLYLVVLPTLAFSLLSIVYAYTKLKRPVLQLLAGQKRTKERVKKTRERAGLSFLQDLKRGNVKEHRTLAFFIAFSAFCFSSMIQMTLVMQEISSVLFAGIMFVIGIILAVVTLLLSLSTVVSASTKTIALMHAFGYSFSQCSGAVLNGYRPACMAGLCRGHRVSIRPVDGDGGHVYNRNRAGYFLFFQCGGLLCNTGCISHLLRSCDADLCTRHFQDIPQRDYAGIAWRH
ncbi:ABC transporter permease [Eubacteriales bacterium OttesenSCG-928-N14]|nr:ABC transporter permease [Eubacteriales bacterium OttesenSCG-928-N14]